MGWFDKLLDWCNRNAYQEPKQNLEDLKMPRDIIIRADIVVANGKILKNRTGRSIYVHYDVTGEIAFRDGEVIYDSNEVR